jgi:hypothetical protein
MLTGPPVGEPMDCVRCKNTDYLPQWVTNIETLLPESRYAQHFGKPLGNELGRELIGDEETLRLAPIGEEWRKYTLEHPNKEVPVRPIEESDYVSEIEPLRERIRSLERQLIRAKDEQKKQQNDQLQKTKELLNLIIKRERHRTNRKLRKKDETDAMRDIKINELAEEINYKWQNK